MYHEEDFLEAATGVLRSVIDKTGFTVRASSKLLLFFFLFGVLGLACLELTRFLKCTFNQQLLSGVKSNQNDAIVWLSSGKKKSKALKSDST